MRDFESTDLESAAHLAAEDGELSDFDGPTEDDRIDDFGKPGSWRITPDLPVTPADFRPTGSPVDPDDYPF